MFQDERQIPKNMGLKKWKRVPLPGIKQRVKFETPHKFSLRTESWSDQDRKLKLHHVHTEEDSVVVNVVVFLDVTCS